jgi:hypothetical protein
MFLFRAGKVGILPLMRSIIRAGGGWLNLATQVLRSKLPADKAGLPTNILNTAVQLAVTALKA